MKLQEILEAREITRHRLATSVNINPSDLYCAMNGTKPFYSSYRKRIAEFLEMDESEVFPEFEDGSHA